MNYVKDSEKVELVTITVTYNPQIKVLKRQLLALPCDSINIIIDNATDLTIFSEIKALSESVSSAKVIRSGINLGLASAINLGMKYASEISPKPRFVLLLDQDSVPESGSVERLICAYKSLESEGRKVGCVGPSLLEPSSGLTHGFHQCNKWRWSRVYPSLNSKELVTCANLNGSGTLMTLALFVELGGLDDAFFIDHVDTEWAFRVMSHGYELFGVANAVFEHSMGDSSVRFWFLGWRAWPVRSPQRHYYLYRNAVRLMRRQYVPCVWKAWAVVKLLLTLIVVVLFGPMRFKQVRNMAKGVLEGVANSERRSRNA